MKATDRTAPKTGNLPTLAKVDDDFPVEGEDCEEDEPVKVLEEQATFDEVLLWGHESTPDENDPYAKGIEEWISFAETVGCALTVYSIRRTDSRCCRVDAFNKLFSRHHRDGGEVITVDLSSSELQRLEFRV